MYVEENVWQSAIYIFPFSILVQKTKGQTQYVFDAKLLEEYMKVLGDEGILEKTNFIIGLGPFASAKSARWMNENLFGVDVPDQIIKRLEGAKDQKEESKKNMHRTN